MDHLSTEAIQALNETANLSHTTLAERKQDAGALARCVHRAILRLAPGKIRELRVDQREGSLTLYGQCGSFYCKQVAQHAAMDLAGKGIQVNNQIAVDAESSRR